MLDFWLILFIGFRLIGFRPIEMNFDPLDLDQISLTDYYFDDGFT